MPKKKVSSSRVGRERINLDTKKTPRRRDSVADREAVLGPSTTPGGVRGERIKLAKKTATKKAARKKKARRRY